MVLFERDVDWRQSAWHDDGAAPAEGETGPRRPFSDRAADDHAVRRHLDDPRAGQDGGSYPRVVRQCVFAPASDIMTSRLGASTSRSRLRSMPPAPKTRP